MKHVLIGLLFAYTANAAPGLIVTFAGGDKHHSSGVRNVGLYVSVGQTPSPFVPAGSFTATWEGNVNADLRGEFFFRAETRGAFKLEIEGKPVLELSQGSKLSEAIQLRKGANRLKATFTRPAEGDAWVRLGWTEKGTNTIPIPNDALTYTPSAELEKNSELAFGRELFLEHRCIKCHTEKIAGGIPELEMDAPSFDGIGARRNAAWMARWILDPKAQRPTAHMPKLVNSREEAEAMAAYLGSLKTGGGVTLPADAHREATGLFEKLLCASCHTPPDVAEVSTNKISLQHVAAKFPPGKLAEFLRAPEAHFAWIRMPNFGLTQNQAEALAGELLALGPKDNIKAPSGRDGKKIVETRGCLNCHSSKEANRYQAPSIKDWARGCLDSEPKGKAPQFGFTARERGALQTFGKSGRDSLGRHVPAEFAERQSRLLNCTACHGQHEGFPPLEVLGGKLRPEWSAAFVAGNVSYKPRAETHPNGEPWLYARMPAFKVYAHDLAAGMAGQHGFGPRTAANPAVDAELAKFGQKLVGKEGGFSCVSCHAAGRVAAAEVFDSEGINLAYSAERLLPEYYRRWLRNPLSIDPQTKMPVYFEEGHSPLTEILDGDAEKQIEAMWHYLMMGEKMPVPNLGEAQ